MMMAKAPTAEAIGAGLSAWERVLLFCLGSDTEWVSLGIPVTTVQHMIARNLVEREPAAVDGRGTRARGPHARTRGTAFRAHVAWGNRPPARPKLGDAPQDRTRSPRGRVGL